jgi:hypothetical protein
MKYSALDRYKTKTNCLSAAEIACQSSNERTTHRPTHLPPRQNRVSISFRLTKGPLAQLLGEIVCQSSNEETTRPPLAEIGSERRVPMWSGLAMVPYLEICPKVDRPVFEHGSSKGTARL